jgi:hypothetical protein
MAVDTAQRRYSLVGFGSPVPRLLPIPQGAIAADDRALLLYPYSNALAVVAPDVVTTLSDTRVSTAS